MRGSRDDCEKIAQHLLARNELGETIEELFNLRSMFVSVKRACGMQHAYPSSSLGRRMSGPKAVASLPAVVWLYEECFR